MLNSAFQGLIRDLSFSEVRVPLTFNIKYFIKIIMLLSCQERVLLTFYVCLEYVLILHSS